MRHLRKTLNVKCWQDISNKFIFEKSKLSSMYDILAQRKIDWPLKQTWGQRTTKTDPVLFIVRVLGEKKVVDESGDPAGIELTKSNMCPARMPLPTRRWPSRNRGPFGLESIIHLEPHPARMPDGLAKKPASVARGHAAPPTCSTLSLRFCYVMNTWWSKCDKM